MRKLLGEINQHLVVPSLNNKKPRFRDTHAWETEHLI